MIERVAVVCPNIGIVYSGMGPDFRILVTKARKSAQAYWKVYGEYPPTKVLTQEIANIMQQATQSGYVFRASIMTHRVDQNAHVPISIEEFDHMVYHYSLQDGTLPEGLRYTKLIPPDHFGRGRPVRLERTWSMRRHFWRSGM